MFNRRTTGSVVCPSCGSLVGVRDDRCYQCGRANPGLWGFGPALRRFGNEFGFRELVVGACVTLWVATLLMSGGGMAGGGSIFSALSPTTPVLLVFGVQREHEPAARPREGALSGAAGGGAQWHGASAAPRVGCRAPDATHRAWPCSSRVASRRLSR